MLIIIIFKKKKIKISLMTFLVLYFFIKMKLNYFNNNFPSYINSYKVISSLLIFLKKNIILIKTLSILNTSYAWINHKSNEEK